jgi:hypothetical protein
MPTPVLDPERHRVPHPGDDWVKETREYEEPREEEELLAVLERVKSTLDATAHYVEPRPAQRRRCVTERKHIARRLARAEAYIEQEHTFRNLAEWWRSETGLMSLIQDMVLHPAYQQIIGLGPEAIPLILHELQRRPDHWFWALNAITREDPTDPEDAGDVRKMTEKWLKWGRQRGYLTDDAVGRRPLFESA